MRKRDKSKSIEAAVRWRIFNRTVQDIKIQNAGVNPQRVQNIIDDAVREVRAHRRSKGKPGKS